MWPKAVAVTWLEVVSWGGGLLLGGIGVLRGLCLYSKSNKIRRAELLAGLLDEYNSQSITDSVQAIDEGSVAYSHEILLDDKAKASVRLADPALLFFSKICFLRQVRLLSTCEFSFFEWKVHAVLDHPSIRDYIEDCVNRDCASPYRRLLNFRRPKTFWQKLRYHLAR